MQTELPAIEFPDSPCPDEWLDVCQLLAERAQLVEAWAAELRERSAYALRRHEDATLALDELLDDPSRHQEAHAAIRVAAEGIRKQRAARGQTAH